MQTDIPLLNALEAGVDQTRAAVKAVVQRVNHEGLREFPRTKPARVVLFGEGSSFHVAKLATWMLKRDRGRPRPSLTSVASTGFGNEVYPGPSDWAFGISHRGKTAATIKALQACMRGQAFSTLVTAQPAPTEVGSGDWVHNRLVTGDLEKIEPHTHSLLTSLAAITTLLGGARYAELWLAWCEENDSIYQSQIESWPNSWPTLWLGQWEGEWLAREAQLKQVEIHRSISWALSSEAFFHGPATALNLTRERTAWFQLPGDPRTLELSQMPGVASFQVGDPKTDLLAPARALRALHLWTVGMLRASSGS